MTIERRTTREFAPTHDQAMAIDEIDETIPRLDLPTRAERSAMRAAEAAESARIAAAPAPRAPSAYTTSPHPPKRPANSAPPRAMPTAPKPRTASTATPRTSQTLERRLLWERRYRRRLRVTDALIILAATAAPKAIELMQLDPDAVFPHLRGVAWSFAIPALVALVWYATIALFRTRESSIMGSGAAEYKRVLHATGLAFGGLAILFVLFRANGLRTQIIFAMPVGFTLLILGRWLWRRWLLHERAYGHYVSRTIVVGARTDVEYVIESLHRDGQRAYMVVGAVLGDDPTRSLQVDGRAYPVVGKPQSAARTAAKLGADTIIVASHDDADPYFVKRLSWQLEGTAAELILGSRLTDVAGPRISLRPVDGLPLIQVKIPSFEGGQYALKRTLDIVVSTIAMTFVGLLTIPLALLIKLDSRGPVFFHQERIGRDGHRFNMLKFRTMRVGAEAELAALQAENDGSGPLFKMKRDPRVTRVGAVLRKLSLDELPQFWNVLRGDMSVVGPRPPLPGEVTAYNGAVYRRLYIKPGITGLWQVSGRSDLPWDESVRLDLRYVENWSIMSDIIIIWRTVRTMLMPSGAY